MKEKGVIREIIPWADTRRKLFWRFRRRLLENKLMQKVTPKTRRSNPDSSVKNC